MALDALKALQLASLLGQHAQQFTQNNPGQNVLAQNLVGSAQAGIQAEALKRAKKEQEKKNKGLFGGSIGTTLGTAAGLALAPATGGASLALAGGLGGAAGGALGTAISGGTPTVAGTLMQGAQGAMSGYQYGKAGQLADAVQSGAESNLGASPPLVAASVDGPAKQVIPKVASTFPTSPAAGPLPYIEPDRFANMKAGLIKNGPPQYAADMWKQPVAKGFAGRFANALGQMMFDQQPKVIVHPDGSREYVGGFQ